MIDVHSLETSRSSRVLWLLEELGLPYNVIRYKREPVTNFAPESLRAIHPLRKSPVIVDNGKALAESGAIVEYLVDRYGEGRLRPATSSADFADYLYWVHFAESTLAPTNLMVTTLTPFGEAAKAGLDRYKTLLEQCFAFVDARASPILSPMSSGCVPGPPISVAKRRLDAASAPWRLNPRLP
jgi:glutathione S-transferase